MAEMCEKNSLHLRRKLAALTRQEISPQGYLQRDERVAKDKQKTDALFHENPLVELKQCEKQSFSRMVFLYVISQRVFFQE